MYPRFGMTYVAIQTVEARTRAAALQREHDGTPQARAATLAAYNDDKGAVWRMVTVVVVIAGVIGAFAWFLA